MKKWLALMLLTFCFVSFFCEKCGFIYAQLEDEDEDLDIRVWNLKHQIKMEEEAIEALKKRHLQVVREKERIIKVGELEKKKAKIMGAKRSKEQTRQLVLLELLMLNQAQKKKFFERVERKRDELREQKRGFERKLLEEEKELYELARDRKMQLALEDAAKGHN